MGEGLDGLRSLILPNNWNIVASYGTDLKMDDLLSVSCVIIEELTSNIILLVLILILHGKEYSASKSFEAQTIGQQLQRI